MHTMELFWNKVVLLCCSEIIRFALGAPPALPALPALELDGKDVNVMSVEGSTAVLPCSVKDLGNRSTVWSYDEKVLAISKLVYTNDPRVSIEHRYTRTGCEGFNLHIRHVTARDSGLYRCQINRMSGLKSTFTVNFKVNDSTIDNWDQRTTTSLVSVTTESVPVTTESVSGTTESVPVSPESVPVTTESVSGTTESVPVTTMSVSVTTESVPVTTESVSGTTESVPVTTESVPMTTETVSGTTESVPVTTESVSGTTESIAVTTMSVPVTTESVPVTTESVSGTTESVPVTTMSISVTTESVPVTTESVSGTTESVSMTTESVPVTTESVPVTTESVSGTTESVPVSPESVPEATESVSGTTESVPLTTENETSNEMLKETRLEYYRERILTDRKRRNIMDLQEIYYRTMLKYLQKQDLATNETEMLTILAPYLPTQEKGEPRLKMIRVEKFCICSTKDSFVLT